MTIAYVIDSEIASSDGSNATTVGVDTSGANLIVVATAYDGTTVRTPTDNKSNTPYTLVINNTSGTPRTYLHFYLNPSVGTGHTFSIAASAQSPAIAMVAFSGVATSSALDQSSQAAARQPGSITPSEDNEVVITASAHGSAGNAPTVDTPFSSHLTASIVGAGPNYAIGLAYEIQTTATARNPTWSPNTGSNSSVIASFKIATVSSGQPMGRRMSLCGPAFNSPKQLRDGVIICEQKHELYKPSRKIFLPMAGGRAV